MSSIPSPYPGSRGMPYGPGYPSPYFNGNPNLNGALNLDPLAYQVYGAFSPQGYGNNQGPSNPYGYTDPIPPSYIGDSPIGFAQNVLDPMMAPVTQTYRQIAAMVDDYTKNKKN